MYRTKESRVVLGLAQQTRSIRFAARWDDDAGLEPVRRTTGRHRLRADDVGPHCARQAPVHVIMKKMKLSKVKVALRSEAKEEISKPTKTKPRRQTLTSESTPLKHNEKESKKMIIIAIIAMTQHAWQRY